MTAPRTAAEVVIAIEAIRKAPPDWFVEVYGSFIADEILKGPPRLRAWPYRLWCGIRGHGGLTALPGPVYFDREGLCKRCGARVRPGARI